MRPVAGTRGEEQAKPWGEGGWPTPAFLSAALLSEAFFLPPPSASALLCTEQSCVTLEFFSHKLKNPAGVLDAARRAAGFLWATVVSGGRSAAQVGSLRPVRCQGAGG